MCVSYHVLTYTQAPDLALSLGAVGVGALFLPPNCRVALEEMGAEMASAKCTSEEQQVATIMFGVAFGSGSAPVRALSASKPFVSPVLRVRFPPFREAFVNREQSIRRNGAVIIE